MNDWNINLVSKAAYLIILRPSFHWRKNKVIPGGNVPLWWLDNLGIGRHRGLSVATSTGNCLIDYPICCSFKFPV